MASKFITLQVPVVRENCTVVSEMGEKRPDEIVSVTLAMGRDSSKKKVTWSTDTKGRESCKHCSRQLKEQKRLSEKGGGLRRTSSPSSRYLKSLVDHLLA